MLQRNNLWKEGPVNVANFIALLLEISTAIPTFSSQQLQGKTLYQQNGCDSLKAQMMVIVY